MKKIDNYTISWFRINNKKVFCIVNADNFKIPFVRVFFNDKICDLSISLNPELLDGDNFDCDDIKKFIILNNKVLINYWNNEIFTDELCTKLDCKLSSL